MQIPSSAIAFLALASSAAAFSPGTPAFAKTGVSVQGSVAGIELGDVASQLSYSPGQADTPFAKKYGHLAGSKVRTVGEAFAAFTTEFGLSVNALYKGMITDIVGSTHLILVNARFTKDPVWSLGILTSLDLLLKNYPEAGVGNQLISALFRSVGLDEAEVRAEAQTIEEWAKGKTKADIEAALSGADASSPLGKVAASVKDDEFWMYSRYFGIGLVKLMENIGIEMDKDEVYPVMEDWMTTKLGKSHLTACNDSDMFFRVRAKLDMMETMMKEIEIREKKRMAERLEEKAEVALRAADREDEMKKEIKLEAEEKKQAEEKKESVEN